MTTLHRMMARSSLVRRSIDSRARWTQLLPGVVMNPKYLVRSCLLITGWLLPMFDYLHADEGMWLFNRPPREYLDKKYNFKPTDQWLEHVQKASVRFNS